MIWEYKKTYEENIWCWNERLVEYLNLQGVEGWELVQFSSAKQGEGFCFLFKRLKTI